MKISPEQLDQHLSTGLPCIILISGDEPLLSLEALDCVRHHARQHGYNERVSFDIDHRFAWEKLREQAQLMSLFSDRTLVECSMPSGKPGTQGSKAITDWLSNPPPDQSLCVITGKLDASQQSSKWVKSAEKNGLFVPVWPIKPQQMPSWLRTRAHKMGLTIDNAGLQLLSERVEGNCLAAKQELEKLQLIYGSTPITLSHILEAVASSSRYNVFDLVDACLNRQAQKALITLKGLQQENHDNIMILWALAREIRMLSMIAVRIEQGANFEEASQDARLWQARKNIVKQALANRPARFFLRLLQSARQIDAMIKGAREGDPAFALIALCLQLADKPLEIQSA